MFNLSTIYQRGIPFCHLSRLSKGSRSEEYTFKVRGVPSNGKANVTWNMTFGTAITEFDPNGKNWTALETTRKLIYNG